MMHIEIHVIESDRDIDAAVQCGLLDGPFEIDPCEHCGEEVGVLGDFHPFAIVLDEEDQWTLCYECALPIFSPNSETNRYDEDDYPDDDGFLLY